MYQKSQLINRRPNMKQYSNNMRDIQDDDDDDPGISSFAKSRVDDDDEKFKNQNSDPDFIDNLLKKKGRQNSKVEKSNSSSAILPSTPPPQSSTKKGDVSNTDPKKGQPQTQNNSGNKDTNQQTPAKPATNTQPFQTPDPSKQTQKTPAPQTKTPQQQQKPAQAVQQPQTPQTPQQPLKPQTPQQPQKPQSAQQPQKQPQPQTPVTKVVEPPQSAKPSAKKEETKAALPPPEEDEEQTDDVPENQNDGPTVAENRPTFVRRNKNTQAVQDIVKNIKTVPEDRIIALEPKNNIEVSKKLSLRFAPQKEFTDPTFPPNELQVFQVFGKGPVEFKRFDLGRELETHSVVDPNDIVPGLQTSSLMQVLAAVAEQPVLISRILEDQTVNEFGYYYVRLCIGGVWKYIVLDDNMGYLKGQPVGATTTIDAAKLKSLQKTNPGFQSEMWPFLIEKGFAKEYGSYEDAKANTTVVDFLQEVTGAPTEQLTLDETLQLTPTDITLIQLPDGIFTVLGFDGKEVTIRNPWGWVKNQPQGAQPEGEFKLPLSKVKGSNIFVARCVPNSYHVSYNLKATHDAYSSFNITVSEQTTATFRLHQRDERYFRNNLSKKYNYSFGRILVFDEQKEFVAEDFGQVKTLSVTADLQKGKYTVIVILDFENDQIFDSTLTYYGTSSAQITRINYREQPNLLAQLFTNLAIEKGQKKVQGQVEEYTYETQHKLTVFAWKYSGPNPTKWTKDLSKQPNRQNLKPITFVNQSDCQQLKVLTTEQLKQLKLNSWQNAPSFIIDFTSSNNTYAVVFK